VEQQQDQAERCEQLEVLRLLDQHQAGRAGAEQDARHHEERDGGQSDAPPHASQKPGGQERAADGDQRLTHWPLRSRAE